MKEVEECDSNEAMEDDEEVKDEIKDLPNQGNEIPNDQPMTLNTAVKIDHTLTMDMMSGKGKPPGVPQTGGMSAMQAQYAPLPWSDFYDAHERIEDQVPLYSAGLGNNEGHLFVCMHGAGHSAMSFAAFAKLMKKTSMLYAFDWRGHGTHTCEDEANLTQEILIDDALKVLEFIRVRHPNKSLNIVGHSMGGSIATKMARRLETDLKDTPIGKALSGLIIIDVVEGTAMEALPFMEQIVSNRPTMFKDLPSVVKYGYTSGQVRDKRSARVSMPS